jgi:hypothetical protein
MTSSSENNLQKYNDEATLSLKPIGTQTTLLSEMETPKSTIGPFLSPDDKNECGCCMIKMKNHQHLANIKLFVFFMCVTVMLTNALTVGYRNSVVTTIERFFELSSIMSGTLSGCLEVGSLIATLFVSYFFANKNIPKCIAISSLCCSIGSFMYSVPHFITNYKIKKEFTDKTAFSLVCKLSNSELMLNSKEPCFEKSTNLLLFIILVIANVLIGSSSAPLYTLGTTYIDNHVSTNNSSIYLGFMYSMLAFGPVSRDGRVSKGVD